MYKKLIFLSLIPLLCSFAPQEKPIRTANPEKEGFSSARLARIDSLMYQYTREQKMPGMITLVARHGKVVWYEKYGCMDDNKPMEYQTIFRIASMTKPVTSVAVMMLYEEGRFQLDDPVARYIPEFRNLKVFSGMDNNGMILEDPVRPMTIRDLLSHTSGLAAGWGDSPVDSLYRTSDLSGGTLKDMITKLAGIPLLYQPGTKWVYGRSTDVLAYLVEVVSGKTFDVFLKERILGPLKMKDTDFYVPPANLNRVAAVYSPADSGGIRVIVKPDTLNSSTPVTFLSGNGGLVSTAEDYMIFSQMLLNQGVYHGVRLLKSETVNLMTANQLSNVIMPEDDFFKPMLSGMGFGLGFAVVTEDNPSSGIGSKGSYWWSGSGNTYFFIDPKEDMVLIFMSQFVPNYYYPIFKEFREAAYNSLKD